MATFFTPQLSRARSYIPCTNVNHKQLFCGQNLVPHRSLHTSCPTITLAAPLPAVIQHSIPFTRSLVSSALCDGITNSSLQCFIFLSPLYFDSSGGSTCSDGLRATCANWLAVFTCCVLGQGLPLAAEEAELPFPLLGMHCSAPPLASGDPSRSYVFMRLLILWHIW